MNYLEYLLPGGFINNQFNTSAGINPKTGTITDHSTGLSFNPQTGQMTQQPQIDQSGLNYLGGLKQAYNQMFSGILNTAGGMIGTGVGAATLSPEAMMGGMNMMKQGTNQFITGFANQRRA